MRDVVKRAAAVVALIGFGFGTGWATRGRPAPTGLAEGSVVSVARPTGEVVGSLDHPAGVYYGSEETVLRVVKRRGAPESLPPKSVPWYVTVGDTTWVAVPVTPP